MSTMLQNPPEPEGTMVDGYISKVSAPSKLYPQGRFEITIAKDKDK